MRVFICWSENRSADVADKLSTWLGYVLGPEVTCTLSTGFELGEPWFPQLIRELNEADAAIICFTPENLSSLWMHFEAGMVFRSGDKLVLPFFLGPEVSGIKEPLNAIQASSSTKQGTWRLVETLGVRGKIDVRPVADRFAAQWPEFENFVRSIAAPRMADVFPDFEGLFNRKTFKERIEDCTDQGWLSRYDIVRQTLGQLRDRAKYVQALCQPWQLWLYQKLINHVDAYAREICENLLSERTFEIGASSKVDFARPRRQSARPLGPVVNACAYRCREIGHVVLCLTRPQGAPILDESLAFARLTRDQFDDKKRLVQSRGPGVDRSTLGLDSEARLEDCARSFWQFDRIMYYKVCETVPTNVASMTRYVEHELLEAKAVGLEASKMPLHYAVKAWLSALEKVTDQPFNVRDANRVTSAVQEYLDSTATPDDNDPEIRWNLKTIGEVLQRVGG